MTEMEFFETELGRIKENIELKNQLAATIAEIEQLTAQLAESRVFHLFWETYARLIEPFVGEPLRATATKIARTWKPGDPWPAIQVKNEVRVHLNGPDEPPAPNDDLCICGHPRKKHISYCPVEEVCLECDECKGFETPAPIAPDMHDTPWLFGHKTPGHPDGKAGDPIQSTVHDLREKRRSSIETRIRERGDD